MIPYGRQNISEKDIDEVVKILNSDFLTQGPAIEAFESQFADYCRVKYAVAVSNATAALHISCLALGVKSGSRVWTSPNTFVASANCAKYCNADIDFVDIDSETFNLSVDYLKEKLERAEVEGTLPDVVIPVHFGGQSADMREIAQLAKQYDFKIIEDASHAIGGSHYQTKIGSCVYSDLTVFSFHPVKIITTGEGGMVTTNDPILYEKLIRLRSHGITRNPSLMSHEPDGPWYYEQLELGYNYRMTDMQAALGMSQLRRLDEFVSRRNVLAKRYQANLSNLPILSQKVLDQNYSAYHLYVIRIPGSVKKISQKKLFESLREREVGVQLHYIPVHTQPYYQSLGFNYGDFPQAERYYEEAVSLPMYYDLSFEDQNYVMSQLTEIIQ